MEKPSPIKLIAAVIIKRYEVVSCLLIYRKDRLKIRPEEIPIYNKADLETGKYKPKIIPIIRNKQVIIKGVLSSFMIKVTHKNYSILNFSRKYALKESIYFSPKLFNLVLKHSSSHHISRVPIFFIERRNDNASRGRRMYKAYFARDYFYH